MSLKKTVAIAAAVGALAAISVPAMALENEFHGLYNFNATFSNFQNGTSGDFTPDGWRESRQMNNYFEQRARLQYTAKVSDDLKLVTQFELDARFGTQRTNAPNSGGLLDSDSITLETKHVYLDYNIGSNFNTKLGIQPYKDTIKGLFIDADVPAIMTTTKLGAYTLNLGFSRFDDDATGTARLGDQNKDLLIWDNIFAINKDTKAAFSYYFLADYAKGTTGGTATGLDLASADEAILLNTFALSAETKVGPVSLSGFAAMQAGHQKNQTAGNTSAYFHGYAANVAAKAAVGPGTLRGAFLFTSGANNEGNDAQYRGWVTSSVNSYNEGGMAILARNNANNPTSTDGYIRRNVTNIALLTMGYDANITDKTFVNGNVGFAWAPASAGSPDDKQTGRGNKGDFMGTELNAEAGYKLYSNLTLKAQAAYMMLGSYYHNSATTDKTTDFKDPENPYSLRLHAQFKF